jgi:hypothetical protein
LERSKQVLIILFLGMALGLVLGIGLLLDNGKVSKILSSVSASGSGDRYDDEGDDSRQGGTPTNENTAKHTQSSHTYGGFSGSVGIAVREDITQTNVCSSEISYCDNEVDNDFHVNPP